MIPFGDPLASYQAHRLEIDQAIKRVLDSGWYVLGTEVDAFEKKFASFHGKNFQAVGVANGTDAIALCLRGLGLGTGDEVITPSTRQWPRLPVLNRQAAPRFLQISIRIQDAFPPSPLKREWAQIPGLSCRFTFMDNRLKCPKSSRLPKPTTSSW